MERGALLACIASLKVLVRLLMQNQLWGVEGQSTEGKTQRGQANAAPLGILYPGQLPPVPPRHTTGVVGLT